MNLKESFRHQNYLQNLWAEAVSALTDEKNITKTIQEHLRSKTNPDAEDELIDLSKDRKINCSADQLVELVEVAATQM